MRGSSLHGNVSMMIFFSDFFVCIFIAMCDLVHDVENKFHLH